MASWRNQLRLAWEQYLLDGDAAPLVSFIEAHPQSTTGYGHEYPHLHRICDVTLGGKVFRVTRCFSCGEELSITPIPADIARPDQDGVPYRVSGDCLARWVEDVTRRGDPKEAIDWERYS